MFEMHLNGAFMLTNKMKNKIKLIYNSGLKMWPND